MSRASSEDDTQRDLERRALQNVSWLAAKLGYRDVLDRRTEKMLAIGIGAALVLLIAGIIVSGVFNAKDEERQLALRRCLMAAYVDVLPEMESLANARRPELTPAGRAEIARTYASDEAKYRCTSGTRKP